MVKCFLKNAVDIVDWKWAETFFQSQGKFYAIYIFKRIVDVGGVVHCSMLMVFFLNCKWK